MLQRLQISNYAIIDELSVNFTERLNIITGETGAGKSILTGALDLVLGKRADTSSLKDKQKKCVVEAEFHGFSEALLKDFFEEHELDTADTVIIRREISSAGKSRSFVNDTPVNLTQLKQLASLLVDMHRQFDTQELSTEDFQRTVLDANAGNRALAAELRDRFGSYDAARKTLAKLRGQQTAAEKEAGYNQYLFDELAALDLKENELEELEAEAKLLNNTEAVKLQLAAVYMPITEGETPMAQQLKALSQKLAPLTEFHPAIEELKQRISGAQIEIEDVANELAAIEQKINYDPARIDTMNDRIDKGNLLLKKHGVQTTAELIAIRKTLDEALAKAMNIFDEIEQAETTTALLLADVGKIANKISAARKKAAEPFAANVNRLLLRIGMPNARLRIDVNPAPITAHGADEIVFLFDANVSAKSQRFEPLHKVASGGELSRLMLSIKSLVANTVELPVLIFDEIDTGISGEAARQVGNVMKELAEIHQVIAITHQPQIAARASSHFFVHKAIVGDSIVTSIKQLSDDERILAIAKMLSGEKPTAAALANAREMMN